MISTIQGLHLQNLQNQQIFNNQLPMGTAVAVEIFQRTLKLKVSLQELIQRDIHKQTFMCIHKQAFTCTKSEFSTKFTLQCFSKDKETFLQTDASKKGFCPVPIHKNVSVSTKFEYTLSRVSPQDIEPDTEQESPIFAVNTLTNFQEGEKKMALKLETAKDPELSVLHKLISEGWPPKRSSVPDNLKDYWNYRDELTVEDGILLKNQKFIVPKNLQLVYIDKIHAGHLGINKSLQKACEYLFWKGYTKDIIEAINKCAICQENAPSNPQHFQYISEAPPHPWHTLRTDIFYHRKQDYLVLIDYFSKFLIVRKLPNSPTGAVVKELSITLSEYGIPFIIWSDNGPCYSSKEVKTFLQDLQITHHTSSPHYLQLNGMAESMVKVSTNLIEKAIQSDKPWHSFIQEYRITPLSSTIPSPVEILFWRWFRSNLSILPSQLSNSRTAYINEEIAKKESKLHEKPTPVADLLPGQHIWHKDPLTKKWLPGATFLLHCIPGYYSHVQEEQKSSETLTSSRYPSQYNNYSTWRRYDQWQTSYLHSADKWWHPAKWRDLYYSTICLQQIH